MRYLDLREYLGELSRRGLLQIVDERICKDTELVPLVRLQFRGLPDAQRKAFWFRNVTDARGREFEGSVVLARSAARVRSMPRRCQRSRIASPKLGHAHTPII